MSDLDTTADDLGGDDLDEDLDLTEDVEDEEPADEPEGDDDSEWPQAARDALARANKENQRYRERWQPFERVFAGLNDDNAAAIAGFARSLAGGDRVAVVNWLAENATKMAGDDLVDELRAYGFTKKEAKAAVEAVGADEAETDAKGPDVTDLVKKLVGEQMDAARKAAEEQAERDRSVQAFVSELDKSIVGLGFEPGTEEAEALIVEATRMKNRGEAPDSIPEMMARAHRNLMKRSRSLVQGEAARRRENSAGRPAPDGPPPSAAQTGGTEAEQAARRVRNIEGKLTGGQDR